MSEYIWGRVFQARGEAGTKALRQKHTCWVPGMTGPPGMENGSGGHRRGWSIIIGGGSPCIIRTEEICRTFSRNPDHLVYTLSITKRWS